MGRLETSIQAALGPDEQVRVVRAVATAGSGAGWSRGGVLFGLGGQALADLGSEAHGSIRLDRLTNLLVITDRRVILGQSRFGTLKAILTDIPRSVVVAVTAEKAKVAIGKVTLVLASGQHVVLDLVSDRGLDRFLADANAALQPVPVVPPSSGIGPDPRQPSGLPPV